MAQTAKKRGPFGWAARLFRWNEDEYDVWAECSFRDIQHLLKQTHSAVEKGPDFSEEFVAARERLLREWLEEAKQGPGSDSHPGSVNVDASSTTLMAEFARRVATKGRACHTRSQSVPVDILTSLLPSPYESYSGASPDDCKQPFLGEDFADSKDSLLSARSSDEVMDPAARGDSAFSPTMRLKSFRSKVQRAFRRTMSGDKQDDDMSPLLDDY